MTFGVVWATYREDGDCLLESVASVLDLGHPPALCLVGEMTGRPLRDRQRALLDSWGVRRTPSGYRRRHRIEDKKARLRLILAAPGEWVLNLDSDTVAVGFDTVAETMAGPWVAGAGAWRGSSFLGCSCHLSREAARVALADLKGPNSLGFPPARGGADDVAIGRLVRQHFGEAAVRALPVGRDYLGAYTYGGAPLAPLAAFEFVHFGEKSRAEKVARGRRIRSVIAQAMREFRSGVLGGLTETPELPTL